MVLFLDFCFRKYSPFLASNSTCSSSQYSEAGTGGPRGNPSLGYTVIPYQKPKIKKILSQPIVTIGVQRNLWSILNRL